ncbi:hypothetical protein ILYODFUR_038150 [Ilyodon furcidens]|uniref:Uncharacterized protein n=1 Tax=Ilyodon furcidens TaxID=33524 RepID=A0ABV0UCI5_9TELE
MFGTLQSSRNVLNMWQTISANCSSQFLRSHPPSPKKPSGWTFPLFDPFKLLKHCALIYMHTVLVHRGNIYKKQSDLKIMNIKRIKKVSHSLEKSKSDASKRLSLYLMFFKLSYSNIPFHLAL